MPAPRRAGSGNEAGGGAPTAGRLRLGPSVVLSGAVDGYVAYDVEADRLIHLNPTAALIVELCDGSRDRDGIVRALAPLMGRSGADDCGAWIASAVRDRLIVRADASPCPEPPSAERLARLAVRLRERGSVLAAFVCQQRAAEQRATAPDAWYTLGELAHIVGRRDMARASYGRYLELAPGDPEVEHILAALRDEAPPARASDRCIARLYERFAGHYDESMCGDLGYAAPDLLAGAIAGVLGGRRGLAVLDLGCGTGLAGARLRPYAGRLIGIDLSPEMLRLAERRGLYDALEVAEITEWLGRDGVGRFDLIAACDTLIYFGDLGPVLRASAARLAAGGSWP